MQPKTLNQNQKRSLAVIVGTAAAAALLMFTPTNEGRELKTYRDIAGVLTYCDGATENAQWGRVYTPAQCDAQLDRDLARHAEGISKCVDLSKLTVGQTVAFVDTAYNIGVAGFCGSSMARHARAGNKQASCDALLAWDKIRVNGKLVAVRGLTLRRERARQICLNRV